MDKDILLSDNLNNDNLSFNIEINHFFKKATAAFYYFVTINNCPANAGGLASFLRDEVEDIAFFSIMCTYNDQNVPVAYLFVAVENLITNNTSIAENLREYFSDYLLDNYFEDVEVMECIKLEDRVN
jgi:hypothetical protein